MGNQKKSVAIKLNAKQLRRYRTNRTDKTKLKRNPIYIVLDNVLDTYNIGAIFRLADAVAARQVILCGETPIPPNSRIKKASINTTEWVDWEYAPTAEQAIKNLKLKMKNDNLKLKIICVEQHPKSTSYTQIKAEFPIAVVVGNETYGVSKEVLKMADQIVEIPMWGVNKSLNVMVSLAIVLYKLVENF